MTAHHIPDACELEQIHQPGCIQPHGVLLCCDAADGTIVAASANHALLPGLEANPVGRRLAGVLPQLADLGEQIGPATIWRPGRLPGGATVHAFRDQELLYVEIEPDHEDDGTSMGQLVDLSAFLLEMNKAVTLEALTGFAADAVRRCTGMERVLVYRFDADGNGEVVAESRVDDWHESFIGFHFPAADIPAQARAMYLVSPSRFVPHRDYQAVPIQPPLDPARNQPFNLELSQLRSVSPIHRMYQRNLGVDGSMSISIVNEGRLWGLVVGHHRKLHRVPPAARHMAMSLTTALSMRLNATETAEERDARARHVVLHAKLLEQIAGADDFVEPLLHGEIKLTDIFFASSGAAVVYREGAGTAEHLEVRTVGSAPTEEWVVRLAEACRNRMTEGVFVSDRVSELIPQFKEFGEIASGVLAISVGEEGRHTILWFRPEIARTVVWGGATPAEVARSKQAGDYLPRRSFARWVEDVRGHSRPWPTWKIEIAKSLRTALNDVILRQMRTIRNLNARLEESDRAKSRFLAHMSHELRTPLNAILGFSEALDMGIYGEVSARQKEGLGSIREAGSHLLSMVNDILDLSKIQAGKFEIKPAPFALEAMVDRIALLLGGMAEENGLTIRVEHRDPAPPQLLADERLVKQMLLNLLSNAIKFTSPGGLVRVITAQQADGRISLAVTDSGTGIPKEHLARVLEPFRQAHDDMTLAHHGTGLGLPIVKSLIELHGGVLELVSEEGQGTTVTLLFPPSMQV